jgi:hypothetical protein
MTKSAILNATDTKIDTMRMSEQKAQLLLVGFVAIAAVSGIGSMLSAATTSGTGDGNNNECQRLVLRCVPNTAGQNECSQVLEDIACNDSFCLNSANVCYLKNKSSSSSSSSSSSRYSSSSYSYSSSRSSSFSSWYSSYSWNSSSNRSSSGGDSCIRRAFECKDGATGANCLKRMRHEEVSCTDDSCIGHTCIARDIFFNTMTFESWDLGDLPGPFPRTETMCVIKKSDCPANDTSCLSDLTFEQISCVDTACTLSSDCDRITVQVDKNDAIVSQVISKSSSSINQLGNTSSMNNGSRSSSMSSSGLPFNMDFPPFNENTNTTDNRTLGCFADDGTWTTDRTKCAADQSRFLNPQTGGGNSSQASINPDIRAAIERRFVPDNERSEKVRILVENVRSAIDRLSRIANAGILSVDVTGEVSATVNWLKEVESAYANSDRTIDDIELQSANVRIRVEHVQRLIDDDFAQSGVLENRNPETLLSKTDKIFDVIPTAFSIMQEEGVTLTTPMLDFYLKAKNAYDAIKPSCQMTPDECLRLREVVEPLQQLVDAMKEAIDLAGRQDVADKIDLLFQQ